MSNKTDWRGFPVHAVTNDGVIEGEDFLERASQAALTGMAAINLRGHAATGRRLYDLALRLREITTAAGAPLIVAGRIDIALAVEADAVQLGSHAIPLAPAAGLCEQRGLRFGYSCHSMEEAVEAQQQGASYLYMGTIFASASKPGIEPCGTELLAEVCRAVTIPVIAIGGIDGTNAAQVFAAGAAGAAAISAVWQTENIERAVETIAIAFPTDD
jgi:thiamine-phosphate pyrophosphorylase